MHVDDPRFPPLLTGHGVKAPLSAFDEACNGAVTGRLGAADLVWARNTSRIELALVLEPDVSRISALQMVPLFELAVIEAVGALMPARTSVLLRWPLDLLVNAGVAGRFRFAAAPCSEDSVPDWLVVGVEIELDGNPQVGEPGHARDRTSLSEEGAGVKTRSDFLEVISAYALSWINSWQDGGHAAFADNWIGRVEGYEGPAPMALVGDSGERIVAQVLGLDDEANLIVKISEHDIRALAINALLEVKLEGSIQGQNARAGLA